MATRNRKKSTPKKSKGPFKIELGLTRALSVGAFIVLAMVWSFILGVFVGRGYNPEDVIPDIARVMPDARTERQAPAVLKPEELEFLDNLRAAPAPRTPPPQTAARPAPPPPEPVIQRPVEEPAPRPVPMEDKFVYTYQVGSFQTIERAGELQQQLMNDGFRASIADAFVGAEPWYRVFIEFESSERNAQDKLNKLQKYGITQPLLRRKHPS